MNLFVHLKEKITVRELKLLLICIIIGLLIMCLFSGKTRRDIESMAVSPNEQYIAFFETGEGYILRCYHIDGFQSFEYAIPAELSAGGHCVVWFEPDTLCALFYRTNKVARFSLDGTNVNFSKSDRDEYPPVFPGFSRKAAQYVYEGENIDVIYNRQSFLAYWLFNLDRELIVKSKNDKSVTLLSWSATEQGDGLREY